MIENALDDFLRETFHKLESGVRPVLYKAVK